MTRVNLFLLTVLVVLAGVGCSGEAAGEKPRSDAVAYLDFDGFRRSFILHAPATIGDDPLPLVLVLHGFTSSADEMHEASPFSDFADRDGALVAYPNGLEYPWDERNPRAWNPGGPWEQWTRGTDDVGFIAALIDHIGRHYPVDRDRVYVTGHSNGARMTYRLATELADHIAAIAPHSGLRVVDSLPPAENPIPVLHLHARNDEAVPFNGQKLEGVLYPGAVELLTDWAVHYGGEPTPETDADGEVTTMRWYGENRVPEIVLYATDRGEHKWFNRENSGVSAHEVIWSFFMSQAR
ncbi:MAG: alpha/beta hydrolase family esterase [bacterium]